MKPFKIGSICAIIVFFIGTCFATLFMREEILRPLIYIIFGLQRPIMLLISMTQGKSYSTEDMAQLCVQALVLIIFRKDSLSLFTKRFLFCSLASGFVASLLYLIFLLLKRVVAQDKILDCDEK